MNPRISALLEVVNRSTQQELGALFLKTRVHDFSGDHALRLLGDTVLRENHYEIRLYPAIGVVEVHPGCSEVQFAFVVFSPVGELKQQRDQIELTRKQGTPNAAFVEMCTDLAPFTHEVTSILDSLNGELEQFWPQRKFSFTAMATSAELDLVAVFVDVASFKQVVLEVGQRMAGARE